MTAHGCWHLYDMGLPFTHTSPLTEIFLDAKRQLSGNQRPMALRVGKQTFVFRFVFRHVYHYIC